MGGKEGKNKGWVLKLDFINYINHFLKIWSHVNVTYYHKK